MRSESTLDKMSATGHEQTSLPLASMSALPLEADIDAGLLHVSLGQKPTSPEAERCYVR
jgi:hypothetical protein